MKYIIIQRVPHAILNKRYCLNAGGFVTVGDINGVYAREDSKTGAEYRCLGLGKKGTKISYSSDWKPGLFYPENTFIYGFDEDNNNLSFEQIETFTKKFWGCKTQRALLPNGWNKGWTWYNAIYFSPVDFQPLWYGVLGRVKQEFPGCEVIINQDKYLEVGVEF